MSKRCGTCKRELEMWQFSLNPSKRDGHNDACRECHSLYRKEYYQKNKDREKLLVGKYKDNQRRYTCIPLPCSVCGRIVWRRKTETVSLGLTFCSGTCKSLFNDRGIISYYLRGVAKRAKLKKIEFDVDYDFLYNLFYKEQNERCAITGVKMKLCRNPKNEGIHIGASLDRIDCSLGYVRGNVRFVVLGINYMKNSAPDWQLFELIKSIRASSSEIECDSSKVEVAGLNPA